MDNLFTAPCLCVWWPVALRENKFRGVWELYCYHYCSCFPYFCCCTIIMTEQGFPLSCSTLIIWDDELLVQSPFLQLCVFEVKYETNVNEKAGDLSLLGIWLWLFSLSHLPEHNPSNQSRAHGSHLHLSLRHENKKDDSPEGAGSTGELVKTGESKEQGLCLKFSSCCRNRLPHSNLCYHSLKDSQCLGWKTLFINSSTQLECQVWLKLKFLKYSSAVHPSLQHTLLSSQSHILSLLR